jgi:peptidoglycan/LPS O-acetylase OafA/YrhL
LASSWIQYFIIGYLFKERYFSRQVENGIIIFGLITFAMNIANDITMDHYLYLQNVSDFPYALAIYLLIKRLADRNTNKQVVKFTAQLASTSLGIYILHPILIALFDWLVFKQTSEHWSSYLTVMENPVHIFVLPIIIYLILVPLIYWFKKIPMAKYILP